jgi:HPr kinase/phosphorylase
VDRIGIEQAFVKILGVNIPHITIPVRPGRDLARLIEVAAFQTKLKMSGQNAAQELDDRLIARMASNQLSPAGAKKSGDWGGIAR